ncbi:MAG: response regulator transcription factor [Lachnospiraceae bacterium]|nr:response regulator transcription factor [Lachnospiraceae bacterium]
MKIAICDDERIFREELSEALYDYFGKLDLSLMEYQDGREVLEAVEKGATFDALFLDIEMKEMDGMTAAAKLRERGVKAPVIFLTSHTEMAMEGYEVAAFRFLGKPLRKDKLLQTMSDLRETLLHAKSIMIRCDGEDVVVPLEKLIYVEAQNNSVRIVMTDQEYVIRKKLSDLETELAEQSDLFVRIHRGYLVNLQHVKKNHGAVVSMSNGDTLSVSRSLAVAFKEALLKYVRASAR